MGARELNYARQRRGSPTKAARFFMSGPLRQGELYVVQEPGLVRQITRVLRLGAGAPLIFLDNSGYEYPATIDAVHHGEVVCTLGKRRHNECEPPNRVVLYQSVIKKDKMEWVVEKCTELGVSSVVPVIAARSVKQGISLERLRTTAREAAEQSRRGKIPNIAVPMVFGAAVKHAEASGAENVLCDAGAHPDAKEHVRMRARNAVNLFIGPEGGFDEQEIIHAVQNGFLVCGLGPRILRSETAAVAATFLFI
ncbi:MAG: RsmE family RNA methyltransferase [Patescibacteria group bacterium]